MSFRERLQQLGLRLPELAPTAEFLQVNLLNDLAFVSGHAPFEDGEFRYSGKIGREFDLSVGRRAAELAVLGCLASLEDSLGSLDGIRQIVKLNGYVNCVAEFHDLFGDSGRRARTTVGVASLPQGVAVEIELIAPLRGNETIPSAI